MNFLRLHSEYCKILLLPAKSGIPTDIHHHSSFQDIFINFIGIPSGNLYRVEFVRHISAGYIIPLEGRQIEHV